MARSIDASFGPIHRSNNFHTFLGLVISPGMSSDLRRNSHRLRLNPTNAELADLSNPQ